MENEEAARDSLGDQRTICLLLGGWEGEAKAPPCTAAGMAGRWEGAGWCHRLCSSDRSRIDKTLSFVSERGIQRMRLHQSLSLSH